MRADRLDNPIAVQPEARCEIGGKAGPVFYSPCVELQPILLEIEEAPVVHQSDVVSVAPVLPRPVGGRKLAIAIIALRDVVTGVVAVQASFQSSPVTNLNWDENAVANKMGLLVVCNINLRVHLPICAQASAILPVLRSCCLGLGVGCLCFCCCTHFPLLGNGPGSTVADAVSDLHFW